MRPKLAEPPVTSSRFSPRASRDRVIGTLVVVVLAASAGRDGFAGEFLASRFRKQANDSIAQRRLVLKSLFSGQPIERAAQEWSKVIGQCCVAVARIHGGALDREPVRIQGRELRFEELAHNNVEQAERQFRWRRR